MPLCGVAVLGLHMGYPRGYPWGYHMLEKSMPLCLTLAYTWHTIFKEFLTPGPPLAYTFYRTHDPCPTPLIPNSNEFLTHGPALAYQIQENSLPHAYPWHIKF